LRSLIFVLATAAVAATPALAQPAAQNVSMPFDRNGLHTIVCQEYPAYTGSRIGKRMICLTNLQWDEVHRQAREGVNAEIQKSASFGRI
jgi:hypothetical protein